MFFVFIGRVRTAEKGEAKGELRRGEESQRSPANGHSSREEFNVDRGEKNFTSFFFSSLSSSLPDVSQNCSNSFASPSVLLPVPSHILSSLLLSSPLFLVAKLSTRELEKSRIQILLFPSLLPPLFFSCPLLASPLLVGDHCRFLPLLTSWACSCLQFRFLMKIVNRASKLANSN